MDHVVLLLGNHPGLCGHLAEAVREGAIHAVGIAAVLERRRSESRRGRQRAGLVLRAVTVGADAADRSPHRAGTASGPEAGDHPGVVEIALVIGQRRREQSRVGPQCSCPRRAILGDLHEVAHQVEELLPRAPARSPARPA